MSNSLKILCFLLLIPFLAAIGHDLYANYGRDPEAQAKLTALEIDPKSYKSSDFGYIFTHYTPKQYEVVRAKVSDRNWNAYIKPILSQYTFVIALIPAALLYTYLILARIIGLPPFIRFTSDGLEKSYAGDIRKHASRRQIKYNRR